MVVSIDVRYIYKYPIDLVVHMHFTKYPTEKEKFVRKINLIEEKTDLAREVIYRKRVAECENVIPRIMRTIGVLNEKAILLEEESWFFLRQNHLEVKSQNLTWCQYAHLREQSTFRTHEHNPNWTVFEQHGSIDVHGIGPLGNVMEIFAQRFLQMGVKRSESS